MGSMKSQQLKLGLWIDLTNTSRFYDNRELKNQGVRYIKLKCRGHGETPSPEQTKTFVKCKNFIHQNPQDNQKIASNGLDTTKQMGILLRL